MHSELYPIPISLDLKCDCIAHIPSEVPIDLTEGSDEMSTASEVHVLWVKCSLYTLMDVDRKMIDEKGKEKHFTCKATGGIRTWDPFGLQSNALTTWPQCHFIYFHGNLSFVLS